MKQTEENAIINGPIGRQLAVFFAPVWLGLLFQQLYNTVDTLIVGKFVGTDAVAAVGNVSFVVQLIIGLCAGIANGSGVLISHHYGAGKYDRVRDDICCSLAVAALGGALFTLVGEAFSETAVRLLNTPAEIAEGSRIYLQVYFAALIPALIYNFGTAILRGMGDSRRPLYVLICASAVNIILDILFVAWFKWGVFGAAFATDLAETVSAVLVLILLFRTVPRVTKGKLRALRVYAGIFRIGVPAAIQSMVYSFSNIFIQRAINGFGTAVIAAWTIYGKVDCVNWMTTSAMGTAVMTFAGQNFGAGRYDRVKKCAFLGNIYLGGAVMLIVIGLYTLAEPLLGIFSGDPEVVADGVQMMHYLVPAYLLYFPTEVLSGIFRGCGDVKIPTIASVFGTCVVRILWVWMIVPLWPYVETVLFSYVLTWALVTGFYLVYFLRGRWLSRCIAGRG